jgi:hypothetical protein
VANLNLQTSPGWPTFALWQKWGSWSFRCPLKPGRAIGPLEPRCGLSGDIIYIAFLRALRATEACPERSRRVSFVVNPTSPTSKHPQPQHSMTQFQNGTPPQLWPPLSLTTSCKLYNYCYRYSLSNDRPPRLPPRTTQQVDASSGRPRPLPKCAASAATRSNPNPLTFQDFPCNPF